MKKLVAIIGSPNKNGKTVNLVNEIIRGAKKSNISVKVFTINDMNIKYCQACRYCKETGIGCSINDDMQEVYKYFKEADAVIIGTPVYASQVSAQTKIFFDRMYALFDMSFNPKYDVKKAVMVYSQGQSNPDFYKSYFDVNSNLLKGLGLDIIDTIISAGYDEYQQEELTKKAFKIGEKLAD